MAARLSNDHLDPVRALIIAKVSELDLDLQSLSRKAGRNITYMQQFVRKGIPKFLPADVRDMLAGELNVAPDRLGPVAPNLDPPKAKPSVVTPSSSAEKPARHARVGISEKLSLQDPILNRGKEVAIFNCPGIISGADVADWVERPGHFVGGGAIFALWVPEAVGRLRAGDLVFIHPARPAGQNDAVVVTRGREIVSLGELVGSSKADATVLTAIGEVTYQFPQHQIMRVALAVFR